MPLQVYYYLYQGNWFDTAVAATLMTVPVLILSAFLQRYLRETRLVSCAETVCVHQRRLPRVLHTDAAHALRYPL